MDNETGVCCFSSTLSTVANLNKNGNTHCPDFVLYYRRNKFGRVNAMRNLKKNYYVVDVTVRLIKKLM